MNRLSKLRQQSASSIVSVNTRHAAAHNPLSAIAHISAASKRTAASEPTAADQPTDVKRQKVDSASTASSSSASLHIPDPNATQERVRRKTPAKAVHTNLPNSGDASASHSSPTAATSSALSAYAQGAWNIQDDVTSERRFYQLVLSLDPTKPESAPASIAVLPAVPAPMPPPPPPSHFSDARSYQSFFQPLLLSDFASQLQQSCDANASLTHSLAAQLSPLVLLQAARDTEGGRGVGEDMWRAELLDAAGGVGREDRRKCERQVKEWTSGELALLRHHQKDEEAEAEEQKQPAASAGRGGRARRSRERQRASGKLRASRVDCYVMCVVESVTHIRGDGDFAPAFSVRVRVHLPGFSSYSSAAASPPSGVGSLARRTRQMWNLFQPPPLEEKEEQVGKSNALAASDGYFSLIRLDSPVTTLREFIALQHVDSLSLLPHLLHPSSDPSAPSTAHAAEAAVSVASDVDRSFSLLPNNFRSYLSTHLNEHQLLAVQSAAHRSLSSGFSLLQGPPGTGQQWHSTELSSKAPSRMRL